MTYDALSLTVNVPKLIFFRFWTLENYWVNLYSVSSQRHLLDNVKKKLFYYMEFSITNFIVWLKTHWNITLKYDVYLFLLPAKLIKFKAEWESVFVICK